MPFTTTFTYVYHQHLKHFCHNIHKKILTIYKNMAIRPLDSTEKTGWVNTEEPRTACQEIFSIPLNMQHLTFIIQNPTRLLKPPVFLRETAY